LYVIFVAMWVVPSTLILKIWLFPSRVVAKAMY